MKNIRHIAPSELSGSVFDRIGKQWMLVSAAKDGRVNMMTASWGGMGVLWNKNVAFVFIRPQRYTYEFTESSDVMTLSFFGEEYRDMLRYMGTKSGRDVDKCAYPGLTVSVVDGAPRFDEAEVTLTVKKLYADIIKEDCFVDSTPMATYAAKDFHRVYVCEIIDVAVAE